MTRTTGNKQRVILAFVVTLRRRRRRAKFTVPGEGVSVRARLQGDDYLPLICSDDAPH